MIPIEKVEQITKEKTARFFPNAIAVHLADSRHVFGSFLSREAAYLLMSAIHKKVTFKSESTTNDADIEVSKETLAIGETGTNDIEVSSLEESSSISGSEGPLQLPIAIATNEEEARAAREEAESILNKSSPEVQPSENNPLHLSLIASNVESSASDKTFPIHHLENDNVASIGSYNVTLMNEFNILYFGICLAILLAIFSGILFFKINAIEKRQTIFSNPMTFEEAESILEKNLILVKTVRSRLEELHDLLDNSIKNMPKFRSEL